MVGVRLLFGTRPGPQKETKTNTPRPHQAGETGSLSTKRTSFKQSSAPGESWVKIGEGFRSLPSPDRFCSDLYLLPDPFIHSLEATCDLCNPRAGGKHSNNIATRAPEKTKTFSGDRLCAIHQAKESARICPCGHKRCVLTRRTPGPFLRWADAFYMLLLTWLQTCPLTSLLTYFAVVSATTTLAFQLLWGSPAVVPQVSVTPVNIACVYANGVSCSFWQLLLLVWL